MELSAFQKYISCFATVAPPWWIFYKSMKMLSNVSFISMVIKKVFFSASIATISNFLKKCTLWRYNYETSQSKIGQCVSNIFKVNWLFTFSKSADYLHCYSQPIFYILKVSWWQKGIWIWKELICLSRFWFLPRFWGVQCKKDKNLIRSLDVQVASSLHLKTVLDR